MRGALPLSGYSGDIAANGKTDVPRVELLREPNSRAELARALRQMLES